MIELIRVSKSFGNEQVLHELSLRLKDGGIYRITGESGIGKTTLLRLILGLEKPDVGTIRFTENCAENRSPGVVFQEDRLCENFTAVENITMTDRRIGREAARASLLEILPEEALNKPVGLLSGGQKRRVAIARAMTAEHAFFVLDEPFNGLDEENRQQVMRYILAHRRGRTVIFAAHDADDWGEEAVEIEL